VCGTPAYFRKYGKPKTLEDLPQHNCLAFNLQGGQNRGWYFRRNGKLATVRVGGTLDCNDGELFTYAEILLDRIGAGVEQFLVDRFRNAEAAGRILAIDDDEIERPVADHFRQMFGHRGAAGPADHVANE